jgi:hypothetical protein
LMPNCSANVVAIATSAGRGALPGRIFTAMRTDPGVATATYSTLRSVEASSSPRCSSITRLYNHLRASTTFIHSVSTLRCNRKRHRRVQQVDRKAIQQDRHSSSLRPTGSCPALRCVATLYLGAGSGWKPQQACVSTCSAAGCPSHRLRMFRKCAPAAWHAWARVQAGVEEVSTKTCLQCAVIVSHCQEQL